MLIKEYEILLIFTIGFVKTDDSCGVVHRRTDFTKNGVETMYGPWTVSIGYDDNEGEYRHDCTGVLVSDRAVLTAAHCTEPFDARQYKVYAGGLNPRLRDVEERNITRYLNHPDYDNSSFYFDLSLLHFDEPFILTEKIQPICLPSARTSSDQIFNWGLQVQGWAPSSVDDPNKLFLTEINIRVGSNDRCNEEYSTLAYNTSVISEFTLKIKLPQLLLPSQFCARGTSSGSVTYGDSGGPVFLENGQSQYELMGIVSGGFAGVRDQIYVFVGQEKVLQWIKRNKDDINVRDEDGRTKLHRAARAGDLDECRRLVAAGANVNIADDYGRTPLMRASWHGHLSIVKLLCDHGARVNGRDTWGYTALIIASLTGETDVVEYLISRGASVNDVDDNGYTALMEAASGGHLEIVKNLVENGATVNIENNIGRTALALADNVDVKKFLRNNGATE